MKVETSSPKVEKQRRMLTALLLADHPSPCDKERTTRDCELEALGRKYDLINGKGPQAHPWQRVGARPKDLSSPVIAVDHAACILCDRCVRACDEVQCNEVIGRTGKGYPTRIGFDLDHPMGAVHLRLLRRVRRGVSDRGADQQADHPAAGPALGDDERRERLPVLRRRLRDHLSRQRHGEPDPLGRGPRRRRQRRPALRQGPLRLGLRHPRAAPDEAAHPPAGVLPQGAAVEGSPRRGRQEQARRLRRGDARLPRGDLGRGARPDRGEVPGDQDAARPPGTGRVRLREVQQRGGVPLPEDDARRRWAPTTSITAPACAMRRASRRCWKASAPARSPTSSPTRTTPT